MLFRKAADKITEFKCCSERCTQNNLVCSFVQKSRRQNDWVYIQCCSKEPRTSQPGECTIMFRRATDKTSQYWSEEAWTKPFIVECFSEEKLIRQLSLSVVLKNGIQNKWVYTLKIKQLSVQCCSEKRHTKQLSLHSTDKRTECTMMFRKAEIKFCSEDL